MDFVTTPGYLDGPGAREKVGLPVGTGPFRVVSTLGILGFHPQSKRMLLLATQPGIAISKIIENTEFELIIPGDVEENYPPTTQELEILRSEVDKEKLYI